MKLGLKALHKKHFGEEPEVGSSTPDGHRKEEKPVSQWGVRSEGKYYPCGKTIKKIPSGLFSVGSDNNGLYLEETEFPTDDLIRFPDGPSAVVVDQVERFWNRAPYYKKNGLLHKRGILLYGPAGCGKSSVIKIAIEDLVARDGVIIITDNAEWMPNVFRMMRGIEKDRPIVNIIEDIDDKMDDSDDAVALLALLDGEHQIDNILHVATTNYPERLEERITQRPGRFDLVLEMKLPSKESRAIYLGKFPTLQGDKKKVEQWVADTEGFGVAHLRELVAAVECMGLDYETTLDRLKENKTKAPKRARKGEGNLGFQSRLQKLQGVEDWG